MIEILNFMFQGFWTFLGCLIIIGICANLIANIWNRFWRHWNIRKHGYPPPHCDANGNFKKEKNKKE